MATNDLFCESRSSGEAVTVMANEGPWCWCRALCLLTRPRIVKAVVFVLTLWCFGYFFIFYNKTSLWIPSYLSINKHVVLFIGSQPSDGPGYSTKTSLDFDNNARTYQNDSLKPDPKEATDDAMNKCQYTVIDPFDPAVLALTTFFPPINCEKRRPNLVYMSGYTIKVNHSRTALYANTTYPFTECRYNALTRRSGSDFKIDITFTSKPFKDEITTRDIDDNLLVECFNTNNTVFSRSYFTLIRIKENVELELEYNYKKHLTLNSPKEVLNVLMVGIDGNSKQNLERHMPKTRNFLLNELKAIELHKYTKVGENTFPNLCAMLTGRTINKFQGGNWTISQHFDSVNKHFLWSDFRSVGYRTGAFLDDSYVTAFHYLKKGWDKAPVDYYMRPTIIKRNRDTLMRTPHCVGDIPEITINHDFWIQMASTFNNFSTKPYFGFSFSTHLTHENHNQASAGDHLYYEFLKELRDKNLINNTVILFFSDHGQRFGKIRMTYNGMMESRMPYVFWVFPPWFHQKYPELIKVLKINQERLTTNTDVYATLRDLVNFQATTGKGDLKKSGISLFYEIPRERTCEHAEIPVIFCVCNKMTANNVSTFMVRLLAEVIERKLESLVAPYSSKCEKLRFNSTKSLMKVQLAADAKEEKKKDITVYQLTVITTPGEALFEVTLKFNSSTKRAELVGDLMRLNMYKGQAECINDFKIRPFCFCKNKNSPS